MDLSNKSDENGHSAPSHFAFPDELSEEIRWREAIQSDKTKRGRCKRCFLFSFYTMVIGLQVLRYFVCVLFAFVIAYDVFVNTESPKSAINAGMGAGAISALIVELLYMASQRQSMIHIPAINARAYVVGGPVSLATAVFTMLIVVTFASLLIKVADIAKTCPKTESYTFGVDFTICNN